MNKIIYILILVICITTNSCSPGRSTDDPNKSNDGLILSLIGMPKSPPSNLSYGQGSAITLVLGVNNSVTPTVVGVVKSYSINPTLPQGLIFNSFSGTISGTPTSIQTARNYTINALNSIGSISISVSIAIVLSTKITFDNGTIPSGWISSGANWTITTIGCEAGYGSCLRSGIIGNSSSTSISVAKSTFSGTVSFRWNVSSESGYDYCKFYIDGNLQSGQISGSPGWSSRQFTISSGSHTFRWEYSKDSSATSGSDTCYIDDVLLP